MALPLICLLSFNASAQQYSIVINGDFESMCLLPNEGSHFLDELPQQLVACQGTAVNYTAYFSGGSDNAANWEWTVYGAASHTASGNTVHVTWGDGDMGELVLTVTTVSGRTITHSQLVRLIDNPIVAASTVPACVTDHVIHVCSGESVEFTDLSHAESSDIVGYYWSSSYGTSSSRSYTIENVVSDCRVTHRVYNNCGCYDEEVFEVEVLDGEPLTIDCYGAACEGSAVTYHASSPACDDFEWVIWGGTLVAGQHTGDFTVLWDNPQNGIGTISLDGAACGESGACPAKLSVKIPIIEDGVAISGKTAVCEGEGVIYSVPLYGSTEYHWTITPTGPDEVKINDANQMEYIFTQDGTYKIYVDYKCKFLDCDSLCSDTLTVEVKPRMAITGESEICVTKSCVLSTSPLEASTWTVKDIATEQTVYTSQAPETQLATTFSSAGHYMVTAANDDYCNEAEFFLTVKDAPPAPTLGVIDPDNPTEACPNSSKLFTGHFPNPAYSIIWEPAGTTASPQSVTGDEVTITFGATACDVYAYTYDRQLQCRSAGHYTQHVETFALEPVAISSPITVCPGTRIEWTDNDVPYQEGVIYEWQIEENKQYCATIEGSIFNNEATLKVNDFDPMPTGTLSFRVYLFRTYCSGNQDTTAILINVGAVGTPNLAIAPIGTVCQNNDVVINGSGCNPNNYRWFFPDDNSMSQGNPVYHTFTRAGNNTVTLTCNPYDYCTNDNYLARVRANVLVNPAPPVVSLGYDGTNVYTNPPLSTSDYSFTWSHTNTNNYSVPAITGIYTYTCTVTSLTSPFCSVKLKENVKPCNGLTVVQDVALDYCTGSVSFHVDNPPAEVHWNLDGIPHGTPSYAGTHNERISFPVTSVGNFAICATCDDGYHCYKGSCAFTVDFIPLFAFEKQCSTIVVSNASRYLDGTKTVTLSVNNAPQTPFTVNQPTITIPTSDGTYTFVLVSYDGTTLNCPLGTVSIANTSNQTVTITTANTANPTQTCDNTAIELTASLPSPYTISSSHWVFDDHNTFADVIGGSVFHTFKYKTTSYSVSVTTTDENGCTSIGTFAINSNNNELKTEELRIKPTSLLTCPGNNRAIEYLANGNHPSSATYNWSTPPTPDFSYEHNVTYTDDYSVEVTNTNYCKTEASVNVPFLNKPIAMIIPEKYYYCAGEEIKLHGEPDDAGSYQYLWSVTDAATSQSVTYTTGTVTFMAPSSQCIYVVNLTVTDATTNCSATADPVTISVLTTPPAPTIALSSDNHCIDDPPVVLKSIGPVNDIHWSNGNYGSVAYYYYPGYASAYYYDQPSGCQSALAEIRIPAAPDFDALLTGCYEACSGSGKLPVYGLLPVWQRFAWLWCHGDGMGICEDDPDAVNSILVTLNGAGKYQLIVNYYDDCSVQSPPFTLMTGGECGCDNFSASANSKCSLDGCLLVYDVTVSVCNTSEEDVCLSLLDQIDENDNLNIVYTNFAPQVVSPHDCYEFRILLNVSELNPTATVFGLLDDDCSFCMDQFSIELTPVAGNLEVDCRQQIINIDVYQNTNLTDVSTLYYDFSIDFGTIFTNPNVVATWSEPGKVENYVFDGRFLSGLGAVDKNAERVCIYALICDNERVCLHYYCIDAEDILPIAQQRNSSGGDTNGEAFARPVRNHGTPQLVPNPALDEVTVVADGEITEVVVMDMHGRHLLTVKDMTTVDISSLASGMYIVRVRVKRGDDTPDSIDYLKLTKK